MREVLADRPSAIALTPVALRGSDRLQEGDPALLVLDELRADAPQIVGAIGRHCSFQCGASDSDGFSTRVLTSAQGPNIPDVRSGAAFHYESACTGAPR